MLDPHFERINYRFKEQDWRFKNSKNEIRDDSRSKALPGQQARPKGNSAYGEEFGEPKDNSTEDGVVRVTPS